MKNYLTNKKLFILLFSVFLMAIATAIWNRNMWNYYLVGNSPPQLSSKCHQKKMIWDKGAYLIDKISKGGKVVLKVKNRNNESWYINLRPIQSQAEQFKTCVKGVEKYPTYVENSPVVGKEILPKSKGLEISVGIQKPFEYVPIADLVFSIRLFSSKFNDESYNLDLAVQNIVENFSLIRERDNIWHLNYHGGDKNDPDLPFDYYLVLLNGKEINAYSSLEFISKDEGETWSVVVVSDNK